MSLDSTNSIDTKNEKIINESAFERRLMRFNLSLISNFQMSYLAYIIIMFLDFLQIVSIIINGKFYQKWEGSIFSYIKLALSCITFEKFLYQDGRIHAGLLIAAIVFLLVTMIAFFIFSFYGSEIGNASQMEKIVGNIIGFVMVLLKSLLQIPFMLLTLNVFVSDIVNKDLMIGLAVVMLVLLVPFLLYVILIFSSYDPFSRLVFAGETHYQKIINLLLKLGLVLYATLDKERAKQLEALIVFMCLNLVIAIANHWYSQQEFHCVVRRYREWQRYVLIWFTFFTIVCKYTSSQPNIFVYLLIISLVCYSLIDFISTYSCDKILHENFILIEDKKRIEMHALYLISLIDSAHKRESRILMQGYIGFHSRNCNLPSSTCLCKQTASHGPLELEELKSLYFEFVANLLKGSLNRVEDTRRIYLLLSFIYQFRLNNKFQAVHSLIRSMNNGNSLMERLEYLQQIKLIELEIAENESKKNMNLAVDMLRFLKFNLKIVEFERILQACTNNHVDFWSEMLETNLNIRKLENCGAVIAKERQAVKDYFHEMQELNSNNAHIMILYGQFLAWVCNQDFQNVKLLEKGETIVKNIRESSKINGKNEKYSENSHASIVVISGNEKELGEIVQTNNFVKEAIGYHRRQLISQNISSIMPKIFADHHDLTLQRFLSTSKDRYNGVERLVPVLCKDGFIAPTLALTKPLPNLEQGVQIVGFLSNYEPVHEDELLDEQIAYILYACDTEIVMGISKSCYTEYGIPKCLVFGDAENSMNELKMKHIFGMNLQKTEGGIQSGQQIIATINCKNLKDEFVITNSLSTTKLLEEPDSVSADTATQVILRSVLELTYHGIPLRIISITKDITGREEIVDHRKFKQENYEFQKEERSDSKSETDELKDLKDFKNFISVKREPTAIRFIRWACIILILVFTVGVAGFIILHTRQFDIISTTMEGVELAFFNRMYMAELSFESEKIFINYNDAYLAGEIFPEAEVVRKMNSIIEEGEKGELYLLPIKNKLDVSPLAINNFDFFPNGSYQTVQKSVDESVTIQLSKLFNIANTNGSYLKDNPLNYKSLTVTNFEEAKYTHVFSFTNACNFVQQSITSEGIKNNQRFQMFIIIQSSILVALAFFWFLVSLPRTLQVTDINSRVLSLFKLISADDVREVIKKCYIFQKKYLVEANIDQKRITDLSANIANQTFISTRRSAFGQLRGCPSPIPMNSPAGSMNASFADISSRNIMTQKCKQTNQVNENFEAEEGTRMINKGNGDKKKAILTFTIVLLFLAAYAGSISGYLIINYNSMLTEIKTMNVIYNRTAQFQEIKTTFTKYLSDQNLNYQAQTIASINLDLISKIYDTERSLAEQGQSSMYGSIINELNTNNLCDYISSYASYKIWGESSLSKQNCQSIENGILTRGIKITLVTIMQEIRSMILLPASEKALLDMYNQTISAIKRYSDLENFLVRPLIMISHKIKETKEKNEQRVNLTFYLINAFFLLAVAVFWKMVWRKYLEYLNESVWRTKSMLNIIPTKIITNSEVLMNEFTSGQLQKVVR